MIRKAKSAVLACFLVQVLLGGCCLQAQPAPDSVPDEHSCCHRNQNQPPERPAPPSQCLWLDVTVQPDTKADLATTPVLEAPATPVAARLEPAVERLDGAAGKPRVSPPDLFLAHAALLI